MFNFSLFFGKNLEINWRKGRKKQVWKGGKEGGANELGGGGGEPFLSPGEQQREGVRERNGEGSLSSSVLNEKRSAKWAKIWARGAA